MVQVDPKRKSSVDKAYDTLMSALGPGIGVHRDWVLTIIGQLYLEGYSHGEAEAYRDASLDVKDLNDRIRELTEEVQELRGL